MRLNGLLLFGASVVLSAGLPACASRTGVQRGGVNAPRAPAPSGSASTAANELSRRLVTASSAGDRARAAAEAFGWAGLSTRSLVAETQAAREPRVPLTTPDFIVVRLAEDHSRGLRARRISLVQVGQMMQRLGWAPQGRDSGEALSELLEEMVQRARAKPADPGSFVPLFIQSSLAAREGLDISISGTPAAEISFTALELRLFLAAHLRASSSKTAPRAALEAPRSRVWSGSAVAGTPFGSAPGLLPSAGLSTVCSDFLARLGPLQAGHGAVLDYLRSSGISEIYSRLGIGERAGLAAYAMLRVLDVVIATQNNLLDFTLHGDAATHHKPDDSTTRAAEFRARATVLELTSDFEKMARDCASSMGFDIDTGATDMDKWRIYWDGGAGVPELATIPDRNNFDFAQPSPGHKIRVVRADRPKTGEARLIVDLTREEDHKPGAPTTEGKAWFRAELNQAVPPQYDTLLGALSAELSPLGLAGELLGVAEGLYQEFTPKVARAYITVQECALEQIEWEGTINFRRTWQEHSSTTKTEAEGTVSETTSHEHLTTGAITVNGHHSTASVAVSDRVSGRSTRTFQQMCESGRQSSLKTLSQRSTSDRTFHASKTVRATVGISAEGEGEYSIAFSSPRVIGDLKQSNTHEQVNCSGTFNQPFVPLEQRDGAEGPSGTVRAKRSGNGTLSGSSTERPMGPTGPTVVISWNLHPKPNRP